jgi:ATP-dependent DNA helicase RecQ
MADYHKILQSYWGYDSFRSIQLDIIKSVVEEKKDTLGLLPTGGGKSIIFQVAGLSMTGITLVVTPLIALMKDQVENLQKRKIKAVAIHSGLSADEIDIALNNCIYGGYKFLYVSPERLETELFVNRVVQMKINLLVVDEAHCISQWGYDFRPSYLKIANLRNYVSDINCLALTATATPRVVEDIQDKLRFPDNNVLKISFERKNLSYIVRNIDDKQGYVLKTVHKMNSSGIIYVRNRKKTKQIADFLKKNGISADYYHAGLKNEIRDHKQAQWKSGKVSVIVATNAFGMGIDKPDVRYVLHLDIPDSLEAYFQEAGRAGRDNKKAYAGLLFNQSDIKKLERSIETNFPKISVIKNIYNAIFNFYQIPVGGGKGVVEDFNMPVFASRYKLNILIVYNSLKILQREGYLELTDEVNNPSRIRFIVSREELYKFQVSNEQFDSFIKLVLRTYTGLFTDYVKVNEDYLAKKARINRNMVYEYLKKLTSQKIINYIPQKRSALIIFTEERLETKSVFISPENYKERQKNFVERISSVISYALSGTKCRSQMLLNYFGEYKTPTCGICDICQKGKENKLSTESFHEIAEKLLELLKEPTGINTLVNSFSEHNESRILQVIQWLLDNNKIMYTNNIKLTIKE